MNTFFSLSRLCNLVTHPQAELSMHKRKDNLRFVDKRSEKTYVSIHQLCILNICLIGLLIIQIISCIHDHSRLTFKRDNMMHHHKHRQVAHQNIVTLTNPRSQLLTKHLFGRRLQVGRKKVTCMGRDQKLMLSVTSRTK